MVFSESELKQLNNEVQTKNKGESVDLSNVEFRAVFLDGEFKYLEVVIDQILEVAEGPNLYVMFPETIAKKRTNKTMETICLFLGGSSVSNIKNDIVLEKNSERSGFELDFWGRVQLAKYRSWNYKVSSEFRCY